MAYYRGDYYRGDYYPGRFRRGDWLSSLAAGAGNLLPKTWTPAGAQKVGFGITGAALAALTGGQLAKYAPRLLSGARSSVAAPPPFLAPASVGFAGSGFGPNGGRRRRINPANSRALGRALTRVSAFGRLASRARKSISKAATSVGVQRRAIFNPRGKK